MEEDFDDFTVCETPKYMRKHNEDNLKNEKEITINKENINDNLKSTLSCNGENNSLNHIKTDYNPDFNHSKNSNKYASDYSFSSFSTSTSLSTHSRKSTPEEQLERFERIYYDNKKYLETNLTNFLFDIPLENVEIQDKKEFVSAF